MRLPILFEPEAVEELEAAALFYEERSVGLGSAFLAAVDGAIERLHKTGVSVHAAPPGISPETGIRRILLHRFPFSIVFVELDEEIRVLAVAHASRRPGYWKKREPG